MQITDYKKLISNIVSSSLISIVKSIMFRVLLLLCSIILAPVTVISLVLLSIYRFFVDLKLRAEYKERFAGLLNGEDSVWAIEEPTALSVINVLVILEKDPRHSNIGFLQAFRSMIKERITESPYEKLLYKRRKKYGYFFWEKSEEIDLEKRIRWLEYERTSCDGTCDNIYNGHLKRILRNVCNQPLPEDHTASWEILIGKNCPRASYHYLRRMEERVKHNKIKIPILFRIHHSLADGTALLKLFLDIIADRHITNVVLPRIGQLSIKMRNGEDFDTITVTVPQIHRSDTCLHITDHTVTYSYQKDLLHASMPFTYLTTFASFASVLQNCFIVISKFLKDFSRDEIKRQTYLLVKNQCKDVLDFVRGNLYEKLKICLKIGGIIIAAPACLIRQALRSMEDNSILHGAKLSGEKVVSYWMEDDFRKREDQRLLIKIQNIKYITGAQFSDVLLAALSASLHKCFHRMDSDAPNRLMVVVPRRVDQAEESFNLKNSFSVGLLPLCISEINGEFSVNPSEDSKIFERLEDVKHANDKLKDGPDYIVNLFTMKYLSALLPEDLLRPLLESHSTMVLSQLPGPQEVQILGHSLKNIVFWVPNRNYTGIGCSMLTYRGYLHLSLIADKALIKDEQILSEILENIVHEIDDLYDKLNLSSFSRRCRLTTTPRKKGIGVL